MYTTPPMPGSHYPPLPYGGMTFYGGLASHSALQPMTGYPHNPFWPSRHPGSPDAYTSAAAAQPAPQQPHRSVPTLPLSPPAASQGTTLSRVFNQSLTTGISAFIRGASLTCLPALFVGLILLTGKPAAFRNTKTFLKTALHLGMLVVLAMGLAGVANVLWSVGDTFRDMVNGYRRKPSAMRPIHRSL